MGTKTRVRLVAALCCLLLLAALPGTSLADKAEGDFTYTVTGNWATITGYRGYGGDVSIPDYVGKWPVRRIGDWAFRDCASITGVVIPQGVTRINVNAFWKCSNLREVLLPDGLEQISSNAFSWCVSLERVTVPDTVRIIDAYAFSGCSALSEIHLPAGLKMVSQGMFSGCFALTQLTVPAGAEAIAEDAFANCRSLTSVTIGAGVRKIAGNAFRKCTGVTIIAPDNSAAAKFAQNKGFTLSSGPVAPAPVPPAAGTYAGQDSGQGQNAVYRKYTAGDSTTYIGAVYAINLKERFIGLEKEDGDWFTISPGTVLEGMDESVKPGDIVEVTVRTDSKGKAMVTRVKLLEPVAEKTVTGRVVEISTGIVELNANGSVADYWLLEDCSKLVGWTEYADGRTVTIRYATVNGMNLIIEIVFQ